MPGLLASDRVPGAVVSNAGLGYGIAASDAKKLLTHSGANPGWFAHFQLSVDRREGFVIANNSARGGRLNESIGQVWSKACRVP